MGAAVGGVGRAGVCARDRVWGGLAHPLAQCAGNLRCGDMQVHCRSTVFERPGMQPRHAPGAQRDHALHQAWLDSTIRRFPRTLPTAHHDCHPVVRDMYTTTAAAGRQKVFARRLDPCATGKTPCAVDGATTPHPRTPRASVDHAPTSRERVKQHSFTRCTCTGWGSHQETASCRIRCCRRQPVHRRRGRLRRGRPGGGGGRTASWTVQE